MKIYKIAQYDQYYYVTNCINSTSEKIGSMIGHPEEKTMDYEEFVNYVSEEQLAEIFPYYDWGDGEGGLIFKDDWHVSYHESVYENKPCYYLQHSSIEYIFTIDRVIPTINEYKGYGIGDDWMDGEIITNFYVDEDSVVYVEADGEFWYNVDNELNKREM